ncbi:MAG: outer membrane lipoprotein-sorting protein [Burkholderiales bacterium]
MHGGVKAYKLEETLANNPYYSKVTTWVATDTGLPIERDYYDVDGKLFKSEHFEKISMVDKVPTVMKIAMNGCNRAVAATSMCPAWSATSRRPQGYSIRKTFPGRPTMHSGKGSLSERSRRMERTKKMRDYRP